MVNAKAVAVLSYITLLGWIIALILNMQKKQALASFHIRQSLMIIITAIVVSILGTVLAFIPVIGGIIGLVLWIGLLVLWVLGLVSAIKGTQKEVPVVGATGQKWFKAL